MNSIVVCVNYDDFLSVTLPLNQRHFERTVVVTTPTDKKTLSVVKSVPGAEAYTTEAFYAGGNLFNKGRAMEEGFFRLGRKGWIVVWDADIVMPRTMDLGGIRLGILYSPHRRIALTPDRVLPESRWRELPPGDEHINKEFAGYFQLFHADDPALIELPWYPSTWSTTLGCDSEFTWKWTLDKRVRLPFEVLHLGPVWINAKGRISARWVPKID